MKNLLSKIQPCDGEFCESVGMTVIVITTLAVMFLSITQIGA